MTLIIFDRLGKTPYPEQLEENRFGVYIYMIIHIIYLFIYFKIVIGAFTIVIRKIKCS